MQLCGTPRVSDIDRGLLQTETQEMAR
jgi:hypothetical protein